MKLKIGYLLSEGFKNADVVGTQAVLGLSGAKFYYVGQKEELIQGDSGYALKSNCTFNNCPKLDILIVPNLPEDAENNIEIRNFIKRQSASWTYVVGISSGVLALAASGVLKGKYVTSNTTTLNKLEVYDVHPVKKNTFMKDGKIITAGPSTGAIEAAYYLSYVLKGKGITKLLELNLEYNPTIQFSHITQKTLPEVEFKPLKVAVTCPPNLYLPDVAGAVEVFSYIPNVEIYFVWKTTEEIQSILGPRLASTKTFKDCPQVDVLITGAIMPKDTVDPELIEFYRQQAPKAKAVVGVCAGVFVLGAAGLLDNRMAVTNLHMLRMLKKVGAKRHNTETTFDGKYYTAGPAIGSYEIALQVIAQLYGDETAAYIEGEMLEYQPNPIFDMGTPQKAGKIRHMLSLLISTPLLPLYSPKVKRVYKKVIK